jgi:GWxTD domain-containing protein
MKHRYYLQLFLMLLVCSNIVFAQDLTKTNLSWKYQPDAPLQLSWDLYQPKGQLPVLMLQLQLSQPAKTNSLSGFVHYRDSLQNPVSLHREPLFSSVNKGEATHRFQHTIDTTRGAEWLVLELQHQQNTDSLRSFWYTLNIPALLHFGPPAFYLQQQNNPLVMPFALVNETFATQFPGTGAADSLYMFVYDLNFSPASTPMTTAPNAGSNKMEISNRRRIAAGQQVEPQTEAFYFIQADTLTLKGKGIRAEDKYFPKTRTIPAFAGPIRYLSTNEEWTELERENFSKQALDRFWLRMTQSEDRARKIIRSYYRRVTQANRLFTTFKEGWKTDMGMIYVLYGPPDVVTQRPDGEQWQYRSRGDIPEINFTFVRAVNPFDPKYYQLVRDRDYARTHFQTVSRWRRGQILP